MSRLPKTWISAECWATGATLELAQCAFLEAGAVGIEVDDGLGPDGQAKYQPDCIRVLAYFEPEQSSAELEAYFALFFKNCDLFVPALIWSSLVEEDWQASFVKSCTTFMVEPNIYIVPSFEIAEFSKNPRGPLFIEMDPENAFGTGQHQTTKLCLKNIAELKPAGMRALDVGTGSGILAILLKKLSVDSVLATEIDHDALITAQKNAQKNQVVIDFLIVGEQYCYEPRCYDLVVANILAPVLIEMSANLASALVPGGQIILSGILLGQAGEVIKAYQNCGLTLVGEDRLDDWCALMLRS